MCTMNFVELQDGAQSPEKATTANAGALCGLSTRRYRGARTALQWPIARAAGCAHKGRTHALVSSASLMFLTCS